jgi:hypothetical protein
LWIILDRHMLVFIKKGESAHGIRHEIPQNATVRDLHNKFGGPSTHTSVFAHMINSGRDLLLRDASQLVSDVGAKFYRVKTLAPKAGTRTYHDGCDACEQECTNMVVGLDMIDDSTVLLVGKYMAISLAVGCSIIVLSGQSVLASLF